MIGNFEIQPRSITLKGTKFIVHGYRENEKGVRLADAYTKNCFGQDVKVKDFPTQRLLMKLIDENIRPNYRKGCLLWQAQEQNLKRV